MRKRSLRRAAANLIVTICAISFPSYLARTAELCGLWSEVGRTRSDLPRFRILNEFDSKAFLDMETCLIWQLDAATGPETLEAAVERCTLYGQGGP